ncbi:Zn-ribbon domain-containing OB-fold protein [Streptomyces decoyicus]|uniref:Zn-ribbon domain-containing OB-fold protein n=1 Tax=Streptomyces decoyicus TaxID=249567 RepID=UPI0033BDB5EF
MTRPVPVPTELTRPFWAAARHGRLVVPACSPCGHRFFTPEPVCPACWSEDWTWEPSTGRGTVYAVTVVHRAPGPGFEVPFALAAVDLEDGGTLLSHVVDVPVEQVVTGMPVRVSFRPVSDEISLPYFVPDGSR